jgi:hypothetical protein
MVDTHAGRITIKCVVMCYCSEVDDLGETCFKRVGWLEPSLDNADAKIAGQPLSSTSSTANTTYRKPVLGERGG